MKRLFLSAFFLEIGFALLVIPWSQFWAQNYFGQALPFLGLVTANDFVRGAVSGLGVVNIVVGVVELVSMLMARRAQSSVSSTFRQTAVSEDSLTVDGRQ